MKYPIIQRELTVHLQNGHWYLRPVNHSKVLGPVDYGWNRFNAYPDSFTFGEGLLAGSSIPGARRWYSAPGAPSGMAFTFPAWAVQRIPFMAWESITWRCAAVAIPPACCC